MAENTKIEWTDHTINLWWGCTEVHKGCDNCYARIFANRYHKDKELWNAKKPRLAVKSAFSNLKKFQRNAAKEGKYEKVFVGSMMDIFEKTMPLISRTGNLDNTTDDLRKFFYNEVALSPDLFFQMLTKRPSNINKYIPAHWKKEPPKNVIFGTSIVDQSTTDKLLPQLKKVKGYRFLSIEPQLGHIEDIDLEGIDWVIQGGESGNKRRPFNLDWAYSMKEKCKKAGVPYFFKQIDKVLLIPKDLQNDKAFPDFMK